MAIRILHKTTKIHQEASWASFYYIATLLFFSITVIACTPLQSPPYSSIENGNPAAVVILPEIDMQSSNVGFETATFSMGWFWGPDSQFGSLPGVIRTRVGYSGGTTENPTYEKIGDHSETIQIDYDPAVITYEQLLEQFWTNHDPAYPSSSTQYASNIFYHNYEQKNLAIRSKEDRQRVTGDTLSTAIRQYDNFFLAEMYHQKYNLKLNDQITREIRAIYLDPYALTNSTSAARINGFLSGSGEKAYVDEIIGSLGLSQKSIEIIRSRFDNWSR